MKKNPDPEQEYDLRQTDDKDTDEMLDEMELSVGDMVIGSDNLSPSNVMQVDRIDLGYIYYHYPYVTHPQDSRAGGSGTFDQPVGEWYADWKKGVLRPATIEVKVE